MYSIFTNIYLLDGDKIFFLHRAADKAVWPDALLGVGGKVEPGEELYEAAAREFQEEAGAVPTDLKLVGTLSWLDEDTQNGINYIFVATKYSGNLMASCDEGTFEWIDVRDAMVDPRTAIHQLRYLPYLVNGEHFSQHMHFQGAFSEGTITKDFNSISYTNHRIAKSIESVGIATGDPEKLEFINTILSPYGVSAIRDDKEGMSIDVTIHTADPALNALFANGIKKSVEDAGIDVTPDSAIEFYTGKISKPMRATLEYTVRHNGKLSTAFIPVQLTNKPTYNDSIRDNFFWSFVQCVVDSETKSYVDLSADERADTFGLLAQAVMSAGKLA
jgi:8-oxo-dGTP pyrophosphatase MutT (NUDIX family)